jgi:FkbM family methyltransferase
MPRRSIARFLPEAVKERARAYARSRLGVGPIPTLEWALSRIDEDINTVFDIGANVGGMTLAILERFPKATVFAFEPCKSTYDRLKRRVAASPYADRVKAFNHGFYSDDRTAQLSVTSSDAANSLLRMAPEYREACPHIEELGTEDVELRRLDDFVRQHGIQHIDLMKVDVEGAEYEVLSGGRETLLHVVDTVFCELSFVRSPRSQGRYLDVLHLMHECGFAPAELYDIAQGELMGRVPLWRLSQMDCVFRKYGTGD